MWVVQWVLQQHETYMHETSSRRNSLIEANRVSRYYLTFELLFYSTLFSLAHIMHITCLCFLEKASRNGTTFASSLAWEYLRIHLSVFPTPTSSLTPFFVLLGVFFFFFFVEMKIKLFRLELGFAQDFSDSCTPCNFLLLLRYNYYYLRFTWSYQVNLL